MVQHVERAATVAEPLGSLLMAMNEAFDGKRLEQALPPGERGDPLADFVHFETISAAGELFVPRKEYARDCVLRALATAERELRDVLVAIEQCTGNEKQDLLEAADAAYYCGDGRLTENLKPGHRCDALADYIHSTIAQASPELSAQDALSRAATILESCQRAIAKEAQAPSSRP